MFPFAAATLGNAEFQSARLIANEVGSAPFTSSTPASLGAKAGDLAVVISWTSSISSGSGGAWNVTTIGITGGFFAWRVLTSGDLSAGIVIGTGALAIYRGAASAVLVKSGGQGTLGADLTLTGYARSASHAGQVAVLRSVASNGVLPSISAPTGFVGRGDRTYDVGGSGPAYRTRLALLDRPSPPNAEYAGAGFTISGPTVSGGTVYCYIFELRTP